MLKKAVIAAAVSAAFLSGCSSDNKKASEVTEIVNTAPSVVIAGIGAVTPGQEVSLQAVITDAEDNISSIEWSQVSGESVELAGADTESVSFTAPGMTEATELAFNITVTDEEGETATAQVSVNVSANEAPSVTINAVEVAATQQTVTLTAVASDDYSEELTYTWKQLNAAEGEEVAISSDANEATFVTPATKFNTTLKFQVTATDEFDLSNQAEVEVKVTGDIHAQIKALTDYVVASDFENVYVGGFLVNDTATGAGLFKWKRTDSAAAKNITAPIAHFLDKAGYENIANLSFEDMYLRTSADPTSAGNFASADLGVFLHAYEVTNEQKYLDVATDMWAAVQSKYGHNGSNPPRVYADYPLWGYDSYNQLMGAYLANKHGLAGADTYFAEFASWYEAELPNQLVAEPSNAIYTNLIFKEFDLGIRDEAFTLTSDDAIYDIQTVAYALMSETIDKEEAVDYLMESLQLKSDDDYSEPVAEAIGALRTFNDE